MSDEEIYFDDDPGEPGAGNYEEDQGYVPDTPEGKYQAAKDSLGFDNEYAVDLFYEVYCDPNADLKLQAKSIKHAAITISTFDDFERVLGALTDVFQAFEDNLIDGPLCTKIINSMVSNLLRSEEGLTKFLNLATEKVSKTTQLQLFIDLKIRQAELAMKIAYYDDVRAYLAEIEPYCPFPPDPSDRPMRNACVRIIILKIELADTKDKDENEMLSLYKQLHEIPDFTLNTRQRAVVTKIEGIMALHNRNFAEARKKFFDAFKLFDEAGSDKRVTCLPYLTLASMCNHETTNVFSDAQILPYKMHPLVAPLCQLLESYHNGDLLTFDYKTDSAAKVFGNQFYTDLINEVRIIVFRGAIKNFCLLHKRIEFSYIAKYFKSNIDEVKTHVIDLILNKELKALIDKDSGFIIMQQERKPSQYLLNVDRMLSAMESSLNRMVQAQKI